MPDKLPLAPEDLEIITEALKEANKLITDANYQKFMQLFAVTTIMRPDGMGMNDIVGEFVAIDDWIGFKPWGIE